MTQPNKSRLKSSSSGSSTFTGSGFFSAGLLAAGAGLLSALVAAGAPPTEPTLDSPLAMSLFK